MEPTKSELPSYEQIDHGVPGAYPHHAPPMVVDTDPIKSQEPPLLQTTVIVTSPQVGPDPTTIICPSCRATVVTRMEYETTTKTHLCAGLLCLFLCWPCAFIPYCSTACRDANHYCPNCGSFIGSYRK
ncbi:lipopolysaccharide-induced tumor necrosis factor-alpha factor homolog [Anopheles cruzii]|uniref:lipopolysaccharide-induced tumor necrosis factor-alpha factor homolog n=1 Tax=Anopheles cruzii TaxID=68878 RepID=UPI0022EC8BE7|nr:lipopolysaccharide-induced tumor necrosis factor-alpha factor homolog [Anopheles cruzii]